MKTLTLILSLVVSIGFANAQKLSEAEVPAIVKHSLDSIYPKVKVDKWEKEKGKFEAEFVNNKVNTSVVFSPRGMMLETETEIQVSELPKSIADYVAKEFPKEKIKEASKIVSNRGRITYEAEISNGDLIFDDKGAFIRKVMDEVPDKDDEKSK